MILMYHKIAPDSPSMWWVTVNNFYRQMFELGNKQVVYLDEYDPENKNHVVITFDGVYRNILTYAAPVLEKFGYPFELFITSDYVGKANEFDTVEPPADFASITELLLLQQKGGRMQWHTKSHPDLKNELNTDLIDNELTIPYEKGYLEENSFKWFAYPYGNFNDGVVDRVKKHFKGAVSCNQGSDTDFFKLNRLTVTNETRLSKETISCIIPSYNYGQFLSEAIESVLRQTIVPDEIIIADDCSTDMTGEIAMYYKKKHPKLISYFKNAENMGIVPHFNKAVSLARGSYIVFLGADNCFQSNYIEECASVLNQYSDVGIAYTDFLLFGSRAKKMYAEFKPEYQSVIGHDFFKIEFPEAEDIDVMERLKQGNFIHGSSMYRRSCYEKIGGYKSSTEEPEDYNFFLSAVKNGFKVKKANNTTLQYRQHSLDQANHSFGNQKLVNFYKIRVKELEAELAFLRKYKIVSGISFGFKVKQNFKKLFVHIKKNGINKTIDKLLKRQF